MKNRGHSRRPIKQIKPKPALATLQAIYVSFTGQAVPDFTIRSKPRGYQAELKINRKNYVGHGANIKSAKDNASEIILRDIIMKKFPDKRFSDNTVYTAVDPALNLESNESVDTKDNIEQIVKGNKNKAETLYESQSELTHLASFALYKLLNEWQEKNDYTIPILNEPRKARLELPKNAHKLHPYYLLTIVSIL